MTHLKQVAGALVLILLSLNSGQVESGIIKDVFKKITGNGNSSQSDDVVVKQSAPICGNALFSSFNENSLSPEFIFITNRASTAKFFGGQGSSSYNRGRDRNSRDRDGVISSRRSSVKEVAREYRFNTENVTLDDLLEHGFNPDAPVTFLMHGFTSGYPLQAWMSAIVEAYTIDRENSQGSSYDQSYDYNQSGSSYANGNYNPSSPSNYGSSGSNYASANNNYGSGNYNSNYERSDSSGSSLNGQSRNRRDQAVPSEAHNLFIINWNYAARGIVYPRAVANIPIVATFATKFINDKLLGQAKIEGSRIQLIGHSLGAHLAGFIGKNTRQKLGRIYGLDPAGPCFGSITGPLYPSSKRLAPDDAEEVITVHTNTALLGIDKAIGRYSVFVEGGAVQPGCKGGGVLKSIGALTWDGGDFDTVACSHSRAPNLLTFRLDQGKQDDCQMIAYECKDWKAFQNGQCGVCKGKGASSSYSNQQTNSDGPFKPVECVRVGLDWQYPDRKRRTSVGSLSRPSSSSFGGSYANSSYNSQDKPFGSNSGRLSNNDSTNQYDQTGYSSTTRRPGGTPYGTSSSSSSFNNGSFNNNRDREIYGGDYNTQPNNQANSNRGPSSGYNSSGRNRRGLLFGSSDKNNDDNNRREGDSKAISMYMRTGDTQPYCAFHYQVILELNEPFPRSDPPMSLLLQDSDDGRSGNSRTGKSQQNSLSNDEFGHKYNDRIYTHLLTSGKKLKRVDLATLLFRNGLDNGKRILKAIHINYMSHIDPQQRSKFSSKLCLVVTDTVRESDRSRDTASGHRYYFRPCDSKQTQGSQGYSGQSSQGNSNQGSQGYSNQGYSSSSSSSNGNGEYRPNTSGALQQTSRRLRN